MREYFTDWISEGVRVLDLGCGDGELLQHLQQQKQAECLGIDRDPEALCRCIEKGISVLHQDINHINDDGNSGLGIFSDNQFDLVTCVVSLQELKQPVQVLEEMLRIGRECIVVFPNFAHWKNRLYLFCRGLMPVSRELPYQWYDTPNIHLFTISDFNHLCEQKNIRIINRIVLRNMKKPSLFSRWFPKLFGAYACYHLSR